MVVQKMFAVFVIIASLVDGHPTFTLAPAQSLQHGSPVTVRDQVCSDDKTYCQTGQTCCKIGTGTSYGCCPLENAVCCPNGERCCPSGTTCNEVDGKCVKKPYSPLAVILSQIQQSVEFSESVVCPDGQSECASGQTCCKLAKGGYGCCPKPDAVCCSDGKHCCPNGYTCDVSSDKCLQGDSTVPMLKKLPALSESYSPNVVCPDGQSECASGQTCCKLAKGGYGCCPKPDAVCCSDGKHCCPNGYTCDVSSDKCLQGDSTVPMLKKLPALSESYSPNVVCPDGGQCTSSQTCCELAKGGYGCCPKPDAVCCSDGVHCCPNGYTCDVSSDKCLQGDSTVPMLKKLPALSESYSPNVVCPDGGQCTSSQTCCELAKGGYGCCPKPDAVCCSDGVHCCPNGYTCDVSSDKCLQGDSTVPMLKKLSALSESYSPNVVCPDGGQCTSSQTCCELAKGGYGCCPKPDAVCCSDGVHCCPNGYTCDVSSDKCLQGDSTVPMLKKLSALSESYSPNVVCPDGGQCTSSQTCCELAKGGYGCCPKPDAVCCSDGVHCCPNGYTCDVSSDKCLQGDSTVPMLKKLPALSESYSPNVVCPDGKSNCESSETCCKLAHSDSYGCCPQRDAVCCSDGMHCCPSGFTCDPGSGICKREGSVSFLPVVSTVICPGNKVSCPSNNVCCPMPSNKLGYSCCPLTGGKCCGNGVDYCCPKGQQCVVRSPNDVKCKDSNGVNQAATWLEKVENGQL